MTYGQLRLNCTKENVGVDPELIDTYIQNRYTEILDSLPWKRQEASFVLQSPASVNAGTISAIQGSNVITGSGTAWTAAMTGLMIRIDTQDEYYQFGYSSATSGTLDRNYEQPTGSALAYRVDQAVFLLPSDCRIVKGVKPLHWRNRPLERMTPSELDAYAPKRLVYGTPEIYAPTWDSFSNPPQMQVELYPVPDVPDSGGALLSWAVDYTFESPAIDPTQTTVALLPFVRPAALMAGVRANVLALQKDYTGAKVFESKFQDLLNKMAKINAQQIGAQEIRMAPEYRRGNRGLKPPNVPWQDR